MSKKSENPMEYKVYYEVDGYKYAVKYFRKFDSALEYFNSMNVGIVKGTIILLDNLTKEVIKSQIFMLVDSDELDSEDYYMSIDKSNLVNQNEETCESNKLTFKDRLRNFIKKIFK